MAVFRVEKNKGYTVMSNHHLRNKELSLKAKGLLSQMLSLPEDWDYTLAGLSLINRESIDAIRTAVWELEKAGYITRRQGRDGKRLMLSGKQYGNWKMPDIYSVQGNVMRKDAYAVQRMLSMSSRLSWIYLHWKNQHWIIQHWKSLCWKNLRWKIQRN